MVNNIRLVQILVLLVGVLILLRLISTQASFNTEAQQTTNVSPSYSCLGPCPSVSAASSAGTSSSIAPSSGSIPSTSPIASSVTQPCSGHIPALSHSGWSHEFGGRSNHGFLSFIFQFLMQLIDLLLKSIGAGGIGGNSQPQLPQPQPSQALQPSQPVQPSTPPQPCNPSTAGNSAPSGPVASVAPGGTTTATGSATTTAGGLTDQNACGNQGVGAGLRPVTPKCTINATDINGASAAKSGDTVCFKGALSGRLQADKAGVIYSGDGTTTVNGIDVTGEGATVQGFVVQNVTKAPGIQAQGKNITVQDNHVIGPTTGGDDDGMRFFGDGLKILHNTIEHIKPESQEHSDCMQTFATSTPDTLNTIVDSNKCVDIANICWIIEGPNSTAGNGSGQGTDTNNVFINNYCENHASDGVFTDDIHASKFINNDMEGTNNAGFVFTSSQADNITKCNKLGSGVPKEVGIDAARNGSHEPRE